MADLGLPRPGALPYLTVKGAQQAINWYGEVFGAVLQGDPIVMEDGRVGHAELRLGGGPAAGLIYLAEEFPEMGLLAPRTGTASVSLMIGVDDTDVVLARASEAGGRIERWTYESHGQRNATLIDPFGHRWLLAAPLRSHVHSGDVAALVLRVPEAAAAQGFYAKVLGWDVADADDHMRVGNSSLPITIAGGSGVVSLLCCHAVPDLGEALERVRAAGGRAGDADTAKGGTVVFCVDRAGMEFALVEVSADEPRPALHGDAAGDLAYLTFESPDFEQTQEFYRAVFSWMFAGNAGGSEVTGVHPMIGMTAAATGLVIPMWRVEDVAAAAGRVAQAGGAVLAGPEERPYGVSAHCRDNQGGRFYLVS
jgi:predicted enzyme related to lactoylglutathione lyase